MNKKIYNSKAWKNKREYILRRDHYLCQESKRYGKHVEAETVHHIYPLEDYPELAFVNWNLISLSHDKHNELHDRTSHALTEKGLALQQRYENKFLEWRRKNSKNIF